MPRFVIGQVGLGILLGTMLEDSAWDRDGIVGDILVCNSCVLIERLLSSSKS